MKKASLILILFIFFSQINLSAQQKDSTKFKNEIRFGVLQTLNSTVHISYERYFNKNSVVACVNIINSKSPTQEDIGYIFELQYRFYLLNLDKWPIRQKHWEGYIAPSLKFKDEKFIYDNFDDQIKTYGLSFLLGFKNINFSRISIDVNGGLSILHSNIFTQRNHNPYHNSVFDAGYTGIAPCGNITIGFKF